MQLVDLRNLQNASVRVSIRRRFEVTVRSVSCKTTQHILQSV